MITAKPIRESGPNTIVRCTCPWCRNYVDLTLPTSQWDAANSPTGPLVQDAFPTLSANDRERLISGTCPKCWNEMASPQD